MTEDNALIIFIKTPIPGKVKTRLAAATGDKLAAKLYKAFIMDTIKTCNNIHSSKYIFFDGDYPDNFIRIPENYTIIEQSDGNIGNRMYNALLGVSSFGHSKIILIGSDIPDLPEKYINEAYILLDQNDAVIGPSNDGGYYLIGLKNNVIQNYLFTDIHWSSDKVMSETIQKLNHSGKKFSLIKSCSDIDNISDLRAYYSRNTANETESESIKTIRKNLNKIF